MATSFDDPPIYDPVVINGGYLHPMWFLYIATLVESLQEYLDQYGIFLPPLTTAQRDTIQSPKNGQMIYNTTLNVAQTYDNSTSAWWNFGKKVTSFTTAERDALSNVENGIIIYNTSLNKIQGYENGAWANLI